MPVSYSKVNGLRFGKNYSVTRGCRIRWNTVYPFQNINKIKQKHPVNLLLPSIYLIHFRDTNLTQANKWLFTKYDAMGRVIMTGLLSSSSSRSSLQTTVDGHTPLWESRNDGSAPSGYTAAAYPTSGIDKYHTINYYDNYSFNGNLFGGASGGLSSAVRGLQTGSKVLVLGADTLSLTTMFYDKNGRVIRSKSQNQLPGIDVVDNIYSFNGEVEKSTRTHTQNPSTMTTLKSEYDYDHVGRRMNSWHTVNSGTKALLSRSIYNEIGQLQNKLLHGGIQSTTYDYNERGWLTMINDPSSLAADKVFGMQLTYGNHSGAFNGNIGSTAWKTRVPSGYGLTEVLQNYDYSYDMLNRLTLADYTTASAADKFNEEISYNSMGNITSLKRTNAVSGYLNNFTYDYTTSGTGNKLWAVSDAGGEGLTSSYSYDDNGNLLAESRKGITDIDYNYMNLPQTVIRSAGNITYTYDATGKKLRRVAGGVTRDYVNGIEYLSGSIDFITTEEGRAIPGSPYTYEYFLKDHLGNSRAAVKDNGTISMVQDYYAFGREMASGNSYNASPANAYRYNGKELQPLLEEYDYGARFYDPVVGRWNVVDAKTERYESVSPYVYAVNDPVNAIDPDGNLVIFVNGFMPGHWATQNNQRYETIPASMFYKEYNLPNPGYRPYPGSRSPTSGSPHYLGKPFDYWENVDDALMSGFRDNHAMYINASSDNTSAASDRFAEGEAAGSALIGQLESGSVKLGSKEKIHLVGHSQGGAFAAGMASVLSKNKKYASILQEVIYLEPHQPADFNHPSSVNGIQISSPNDIIASKWNWAAGLKGKTSYSRVRGTRKFLTNDSHDGDTLGGHSVGTNIDEIVSYFRSLGITVNVK